jgi:glycosyltransferase involved in cell wall biosynthesis
MTPLRFAMVWPHYAVRVGIPSCMIGLCERMPPHLDVTMWSPGASPDVRNLPFMRLVFRPLVFSAMCRLGVNRIAEKALLGRRYLKGIAAGTHAWVWPGMGVDFLRELRRRGHRIVLERINTSVASARRVLDAASRVHGLAPKMTIDDALVREEAQELELADFVFACAPHVARSFLEAGVPRERLLESTYGWDPERFVVPRLTKDPSKGPVFLFVGSNAVRKGIPELLENWDRSGVKGRLRIVGPVEPWVLDRYRRIVERPDVELLGYRKDLPELYATSDVFVLMSHEEGSALVTYLALAAGLPCLVSEPGAGGVVVDGVEGFIQDPYDSARYVESLRRLAEDAALRERLGRAALAASARYTWREVAQRRAKQLEQAFGGSA